MFEIWVKSTQQSDNIKNWIFVWKVFIAKSLEPIAPQVCVKALFLQKVTLVFDLSIFGAKKLKKRKNANSRIMCR